MANRPILSFGLFAVNDDLLILSQVMNEMKLDFH